jgi:uncharacterized SAM-binding protein YcdF (DUF218 family)
VRKTLWRALAILVLVCLPGALLSLGSALLSTPCTALDVPTSRANPATALVLGGGIGEKDGLNLASYNRADAAADLWNAGGVEKLFITGGGMTMNGVPVARAMARVAIDAGVPETAIEIETDSASTLENALFSRTYLANAGTVVLVSSGFHLWRGRASMVWAGQPIDTACRSGRFDNTSPKGVTVMMLLEGLKWPANVGRAAVWSLGHAVGIEDRLPAWLLA